MKSWAQTMYNHVPPSMRDEPLVSPGIIKVPRSPRSAPSRKSSADQQFIEESVARLRAAGWGVGDDENY